MFGWLKPSKWRLVGTSGWKCHYGEGLWLYYENEKGERKVEPSFVPYMYQGIGGKTRIPGYSDALAWGLGAGAPKYFVSTKE